MAVTTEPKQDNIYWLGDYPKKDPGSKVELLTSKYCVVDGYCWTTAKDGTVFCAGSAEKIKQRLSGDTTDAPETHPSVVKEVGQKSEQGETTIPKDAEAKAETFVPAKMGRPEKAMPVEKINQLDTKGLSSRQIADKLGGISYKSVQRVINGQRVLV